MNKYKISKQSLMQFCIASILLSVLLHSITASATETCTPVVTIAPESIIMNYDPFLPGATVENFEFELTNETSSDCEFDIAVLKPGGEPILFFNINSTNVEVEVRPSSDGAVLERTNIPGVYAASIAANSSKTFIFEALVIKDAVAEAIDHIVPMKFQLRERNNSITIGEAWYSDFILRSIPRAQLNFTGTSGSFGEGASLSVVNFGIAKTGDIKSIYIQLRANTISQLSINSENKGKLVHNENSETATPISYSARLNGEDIDLSTMVRRNYDVPKTYRGQSLPFDLILGDVSATMAGSYEDTITIEFSPL